jgi:hypothetical protein
VVGIVRIVRVRSTASHKQYTSRSSHATFDPLLKPIEESGAASVTWSAVEANTGVICASLLYIKPLIVKVFTNMLLSQGPSRRNLQLPTIHPGETQDSNTWTCSTYVDSGRRNTGSDVEAQRTAPGINVTFETMQMSEVNSSRETAMSSNACEPAVAWAKSWEVKDSMNKRQEQNRQ